ncbi:hypothetical protein CONCODRAFT_7216 [Conidiobolus coronatus NRRL 28638]|uniref:Uncharacterized protein n=1 Tax=Conidiobolus coronatus (strain ATCC 28846 / CBS 209.66 / NRRL 28638) TaxID=796925 RepID=A0A137P5N7_CONC2|nr:hypothetical protein CONCODRAFT_7216 [Conidiobolus coronatus NRRL 28638]|eukprot:KXN70244.1 hypothetical protein CONCODRAFT_7216 [Conidiobolus coronatus NRRL 28638]
MCTLMDILFIVLENLNRYDIAVKIKTSSFAFKIVLECLCFQFIKGYDQHYITKDSVDI